MISPDVARRLRPLGLDVDRVQTDTAVIIGEAMGMRRGAFGAVRQAAPKGAGP